MNIENNKEIETIIEEVSFRYESFVSREITLHVLREDLIHPLISGNKYRKLKYNLLGARKDNNNTLLTFGGAYSNHIAAVAAAGNEFGFKTIGIIRGEELVTQINENPTLQFAKKQGMDLHFVTRKEYRTKENPDFIDKLRSKFGSFYLLPEGGTNALAVKGCEEILNELTKRFDYICVAVGTGGTMAGLVKASLGDQTVIGFSALKGTFQSEIVQKYTDKTNYKILDSYCFGGYAKIDLNLIRFINEFKMTTDIPLDPIYTGKMMYGIMDMVQLGFFEKKSRILAIHTGGLQGIEGMNQQLKRKNLPLITT